MIRQFHLLTIEKEGNLLSKCIGISIDSTKWYIQAHPPTFISMTEKGDIEACPDVLDDSQDETSKEGSLRVLSRTKSAASAKDPGPPPDGGVHAWTQVLAGHLIVLITW